jgi:hypothetical protein
MASEQRIFKLKWVSSAYSTCSPTEVRPIPSDGSKGVKGTYEERMIYILSGYNGLGTCASVQQIPAPASG